MQLSLDAVRHAARLLHEADLYEICLEDVNENDEPQRVLLRRDKAPQLVAVAAPLLPAAAPMEAPPPGAPEETPEAAPTGLIVTAPAVGLYRQPPVALRAGDAVTRGQVVAIVESMKVPNEIAAPADGVVREISVEDGRGVEYGQELLILDAVPRSAGD